MGRPSKLTPERQQRLLDAIRAGHYLETACALAGISYSTMRDWVTERKAKPGRYGTFGESLKAAEAEAEQRALSRIELASLEQWQAAAWLLERRHPQRWARTERLEHSGPEGKPLGIVIYHPALDKDEDDG